MFFHMLLLFFFCIVTFYTLVDSQKHDHGHSESQSQKSILVNIQPGSNPDVKGQLTLMEYGSGVAITGQISGLAPGRHGFHIHEKGDLSRSCIAAGPHFNPFQSMHGDPANKTRHVGDLGNIEANHLGVAYVDVHDTVISLDPTSQAFVGNRALVVHEKPDDVGRGGNEESKLTGNAGARSGCGIINIGKTTHEKGSSGALAISPMTVLQTLPIGCATWFFLNTNIFTK